MAKDFVKTKANQQLSVIVVEGNVGKIQPLRYFDNKTAILNFSIANDQSYKKSDGSIVDQTVWYDVSILGARAENLWENRDKFINKLKSVIVTGTITANIMEDYEGKSYLHLRLRADDIKAGDWKKDSEGSSKDDDPEDPETQW